MTRLARIFSRACIGIDAPEIQVEVHLTGGLVKTTIIGLPETAVREASDRVRSALLNGRFEYPTSRMTISLAPAELPKEGSRFDLPIALGILAASQQIPTTTLSNCEFVGELSLGGDLRHVRGILPIVLAAKKAKRTLVVPSINAHEASLVRGADVRCARNLAEVVCWLLGQTDLPRPECPVIEENQEHSDLRDVVGQHRARRALEVAAAGNHNLLFTGPPGTGKTMLASRLPGILPGLSQDEALETAAVTSISGHVIDPKCWRQPPIRSPHHTASAVALVGGGAKPMPGEISLAHNGVLFLDELPEFSRHVLEVLREPLESGCINISRAAGQAHFPARFQLIASSNPCPCGFHGDRTRECICSAEQVSRYRNKISGPLLDRIDLFVEVSRPRQMIIPGNGQSGESSKSVRKRVLAAREIQINRQQTTNARLDSDLLIKHCQVDPESKLFFESAAEKLSLSPRGCQRVLKVARSIADLEESVAIKQPHLAEALGYRQLTGRNI